MKKILPFFILTFLAVLLIIAILNKNRLNNFISDKMKEQTTSTDSVSAVKLIEIKYNYVKNGQDFDFTLLEFGSNGCTICKQMEPVLEEISSQKDPKVNVSFLNIMHPENLLLMKYYGISAVPMQILLDKQGIEFYRHYGFIPAEKLLAELIRK